MRIILLAFCACLHLMGWGQINTYHAVKSKGSDNASFIVDDVTGLNGWDRVMIIQMKGGVTMNTIDGSNFGKIGNNGYGNVGKYEIATVCKVDKSTNTIHFLNVFSNSYDYSNGGKIQVIKIPVFDSYTVTSKLEPTAWDSASGKGGVLAMIVEDDLILGANISADGKGFKGGKYEISSGDCSPFQGQDKYIYNPKNLNPQNGAYKGESIFNIYMNIGGGKGANGNGGGGGNNHNNGGGGGANLSPGGNGGGNSSTGFFTCKNSDPGVGGYGITVGSISRIFMGGGGGAGHVNNALLAPIGGGSGGGIIFIQAGRLISNGYSISSNGAKGGDQQGDGAAGGGAGGSVIMNVTTYTGAVNIQANGGAGGNVDNENIPGNCYAEGGGGSGGVIYFKGTKLATGVSVAGGLKGLRNNSKECGTVTLGGDGQPGSTLGGYSYTIDGAISNTCPNASTLPVKLVYFNATNQGPQVSIEWKIDNPEDGYEYTLQRRDNNDFWKNIQNIPAGERITVYQRTDGPLAIGAYLYRLKIIEKDRSVSYSSIQQVNIKAEDISRLIIHPNPATSEITVVTAVQNEEWLNIYDMKSRLVYRKKVNPNDSVIRQDVSFLSEGVYMIRVGKLTARFVVLK